MTGDMVLRAEVPYDMAMTLITLQGLLVDVWHEDQRLLDRVAKVAVDARDPERCRVTITLRRQIA